MKTKNIIIVFSILSIIFFSSCTTLLKKALSIKNPKVESNQTIQNYLERIDCPIQKRFVLDCPPDSMRIYQNIMKSFNNNPQVFKNNIKYCYHGKSKCPRIKLSNITNNFDSTYTPCQGDSLKMNDILQRLIPLPKSEEVTIVTDKIYIFIYWSKFLKTNKNKKEFFNWLQNSFGESSEVFELVLVNVDLNNNWGLIEGEKLRIKFKMNKIKSVDLEFGRLPYSK